MRINNPLALSETIAVLTQTAENQASRNELDNAESTAKSALALQSQLEKVVEQLANVAAPVAGAVLAGVVDTAIGDDHPLLSGAIGAVAGLMAGHQAKTHFTESTANSTRARIYCVLGHVAKMKGDKRQARKYYAMALEIAPDEASTQQRLAEVLS